MRGYNKSINTFQVKSIGEFFRFEDRCSLTLPKNIVVKTVLTLYASRNIDKKDKSILRFYRYNIGSKR